MVWLVSVTVVCNPCFVTGAPKWYSVVSLHIPHAPVSLIMICTTSPKMLMSVLIWQAQTTLRVCSKWVTPSLWRIHGDLSVCPMMPFKKSYLLPDGELVFQHLCYSRVMYCNATALRSVILYYVTRRQKCNSSEWLFLSLGKFMQPSPLFWCMLWGHHSSLLLCNDFFSKICALDSDLLLPPWTKLSLRLYRDLMAHNNGPCTLYSWSPPHGTPWGTPSYTFSKSTSHI